MRVIILTESGKGTAAHHLPYLLKSPQIEIVQVIRSMGKKPNRKKHLWNKVKKSFTIGPLGVLNGIRMRKWFGKNVDQQLQLADISTQCHTNGIPYSEVDRTNSSETIQLFRAANADIDISLGNSFISKKVFSIPANGMINIHHEILPDFQNAQSIIWQLYNKSTVTGYTIHVITSDIDGGNILYQETIPISFCETLSETIASTSVQLLKASANGLVTLLENYTKFAAGSVPQGPGQHYTTPTALQFLRIWKNFNKLKNKNGKS